MVASEDDPRWLGHRPFRELLVIAHSPAEARLVAAREEGAATAGSVGNESAHLHSRYNDEKLYRVVLGSWNELNTEMPTDNTPRVVARQR
ncbi:MAG: hypothetical protein R3245_04605 [Kiloniellales bacterium]|nr:hypothetical protein [Kiloniellales bacterium]